LLAIKSDPELYRLAEPGEHLWVGTFVGIDPILKNCECVQEQPEPQIPEGNRCVRGDPGHALIDAKKSCSCLRQNEKSQTDRTKHCASRDRKPNCDADDSCLGHPNSMLHSFLQEWP
jgi:hypothetical protein